MKPLHLFIFLSVISIALAAEINDSQITDGTTILFINETRYYEDLIVSPGIYFSNYRLNESSTESITFNISTAAILYENQTHRDLPYFSASSLTSKTITQNASDNQAMTIYITSACAGDGTIKDYICDGCTISSWSCINDGNNAILVLTGVNRGSTVISVEYYLSNQFVYSVCQNLTESMGKAAIWFGLIIIAFFAFMVIGVWQNQDLPDTSSIGLFLIGLGTAAVVLVIYIIIISQMC